MSSPVVVPAEDGVCPDATPSVSSGVDRSFAVAMCPRRRPRYTDAAMATVNRRSRRVSHRISRTVLSLRGVSRVAGVPEASTRSDRVCANPAREKQCDGTMRPSLLSCRQAESAPCWSESRDEEISRSAVPETR